ncbi:MAG: AsmA family protein [Bacteroidales bacterium]|nr:AsmA family protein [Bacteroidales bacterium]
MKSLGKLLKITGISIGVIVGVIFILLLVIPFFIKDKAGDIVKMVANEYVNAKVDFSDLDISLIRQFPKASIAIDDLSINGSAPFEEITLVSAKRIEIVVNLMSLFSDDGYEVEHIILNKPNVNAVINSNNIANWDIMKASESVEAEEIDDDNENKEEIETENELVTDTIESDESAPFKLHLRKFSIEEANISYIDSVSNMAFGIEDFNLYLSGNMNDMRTDLIIETNIDKLNAIIEGVSYIKNATLDADLNVDADLENSKFTLKENSIALNAIKLNIDGWVAMPTDDAIEMDLSLNSSTIKFKDILSMIPAIYQNSFEDLTASGNLKLVADAKGILSGDYLPDFKVTLDVNNGKMAYEGLPKTIDDITLKAGVTHPQGDIDLTKVDASLGFSIANNPFSVSAKVSTPISDLNFDAGAKGVLNLGMIKEVYPLGDSIDINGTFDADLNFKGKLSDIEKERFEKITGEGYLNITDMLYKSSDLPDVLINKLAVSVSTKALAIKDMNIKIGKSNVKANGSVNNYIAYLLRDETLNGSLNVSSSLLDLNELMGDSTTESDNVQTEDSSSTTKAENETTESVEVMEQESEPFEIPKNLNLTLKSNFNKVLFQKIVIDKLNGTISVKDGVAKMNSLKFNAFGGSVAANGEFNTAKDKYKPTVNFNLDLAKVDFKTTFEQLDVVKEIVPLFAKTGGNFSADIKLSSTLDKDFNPDLNSIVAIGSINSNEITISNIEAFNLIANNLKTDALRNINAVNIRIPFEVKNGKVTTKPFDLKIKDTNINLGGVTGLDQTINYNIVVTLPEDGKASQYVGKIPGTITGTFTKPIVKLDLASIAKEAVKNTITTQIEKATGKDMSEQIAKLREEADNAANKLVEVAKKEGDKLVEKAKNPIAKIAAQAAAKKLVEEAEKQGDKLRAKAEEEITKLESKL